MNRNRIPEELAKDLAGRSPADYQHGAVIFDHKGIFAWGWNHQSDDKVHGDFSVHAERHAIFRAQRSRNLRQRLIGATMVVYGQKKSNGHVLCSLPCLSCIKAIRDSGIVKVRYSSDSNNWITSPAATIGGVFFIPLKPLTW